MREATLTFRPPSPFAISERMPTFRSNARVIDPTVSLRRNNISEIVASPNFALVVVAVAERSRHKL